MNTFFEKARCEGREPDWLSHASHELPSSILKVVYSGRNQPCFISAPAGLGKTAFACAYARRFHSFYQTFWFSGKDEGFLDALCSGDLRQCLEKEFQQAEEGLVVIDDLPSLQDDEASILSDLVDAIIAANWEVLVLQLPSNDSLAQLQKDRQLVLGRHLVAGGKERTEEESLYCIQSFFEESLPPDYFRAALCLLLLQEGEMKEVFRLSPTITEEAIKFLTSYYPQFGISARRTSFRAWPVSPEQLKDPVQTYVIDSSLELDDAQMGEFWLLSDIAGLLLERKDALRAFQVLELGHSDLSVVEGALDALDDVPPQPPTGGFDLMGRTKRQGTARRASTAYQEVKVGQELFPPLEAKLFGGLEVKVGDRIVAERDWSKAKAKALFAHLLLGFGNEVTRASIISSLWPDMDGASGLNNFYSVWSHMKNALEDENRNCPYVLKVGTKCKVQGSLVHSDVERFEELSREMVFHGESSEEMLEVYLEMESLYRGDLFTGDIRDSVLEGMSNRYRAIMVNNMLAASDWFMQVGDSAATLWFAWKAYDADMSREDVCRNLMQAQALAGQRTAAMETFFNLKTYLAEELGVRPSRQTVQLFEKLVSEREDSSGLELGV